MRNEGKKSKINRRGMLKGLAALPFAYGLKGIGKTLGGPAGKGDYITEEASALLQELRGTLPKGRLGEQEISRLVMGCNPMGGWSHARDLVYVSTLSRNWHTATKMKETWAVGEKAGINLANLTANMYATFNEYKRETGSKLLNMCQCSIGQPADRLAPLKQAVQDGADFLYIQGQNADSLATTDALDVLFQAMEYTHSQGLLFGVGAHSVQTIIRSINLGVKPDFYYKTFHHDNYWSATPRQFRVEYPQSAAAIEKARGSQSTTVKEILAGSPGAPRADHNMYNDNMWDQFSEQTIELFNSIKVPFFGFKVMAAGAIKPADGIRWAFENGADFVCAGMYDFQIVDDVNITIEILGCLGPRIRPWYA